jgi:flagellar motor switch protein FliN/FliY
MTIATDAATRTALADMAEAAGLEIDPSFDGDRLATASGPFLTADLSTGTDHGSLLYVAVRDDGSGGGELLLTSLCRVAAPDRSPATAEPVASGAELKALFEGPIEVIAFTDGSQVAALVVAPIERRRGDAEDLASSSGSALSEPLARAAGGFDKLANVSLDVSVELGRTRVSLAEVLSYDVGSVVELDRPAGAPVDVRVNGTLLAQGEVVLIDDEYAVRITAIVDTPGEV